MPEPTVQNQNISNAQLLEMMKQFAKELKAPTEEELEKKAIEQQRKKAAAQASIQEAEDDCKNYLSMIRRCHHKNKRKHTWVANICPNGVAVAVCQQCRKDFVWMATDQQKMQGVNLFEFDFVDEAMIRSWEKAYRPTIGEKPMRVKMATRAGMKEEEAWAI